MNTVKLMVVNAARERERHLIGCVSMPSRCTNR